MKYPDRGLDCERFCNMVAFFKTTAENIIVHSYVCWITYLNSNALIEITGIANLKDS